MNPPEHRKFEWKIFEAFIKKGYLPSDPNGEQLALTVAEHIGQKIMTNEYVDWNDDDEVEKLQNLCILCMCKNKRDAFAFIDEMSLIWTEIDNPMWYDLYILEKIGKTKAKTKEPKKKEIEPSRSEPFSSSEKAYVERMRNADKIDELVFHINYVLDWFDKVKDNWWKGIFKYTLSRLEKISKTYEKHKSRI